MASKGGKAFSGYGSPTKPKANVSDTYDAAVKTQGQDYDTIFGGYQNLLNQNGPGRTNQSTFNPANASLLNYTAGNPYKTSAQTQQALDQLQQFSTTGGYSENDIANLRARGTSPIRASYANALREMNRNRSLSGSSAGQNALRARMAREQGGLMSGALTNVNAGIAENVTRNKLSSTNQLATLSAAEAARASESEGRETDAKRRVDEINAQVQNALAQYNSQGQTQANQFGATQGANNQLNALQGMTSLYGTTPALSNMFGQQALQQGGQNLQAQQIANSIKNQRAGIGLNLVGQQPAGGNTTRRAKG